MVVGGLFLLTGVAKALMPGRFAQHVAQLELLPRRLLTPAVGLFIAGEWAVGAALLVGAQPAWVVPATAALLALLSGLTAWAAATGRATDCGCYAGLFELKPWQSLAVNAASLALLVPAWLFAVEEAVRPWQTVAVGTAFGAGALTALASYLCLRRWSRPLLDLSPLRVGRAWQPAWVGDGAPERLAGPTLVVFLSRTCPVCKNWLKVLNVIHRRPDLPRVLGVVSHQDQPQAFAQEAGLVFPVLGVEPGRLARLGLYGYPTALLLEGNRIRERWTGVMPGAFVERLRQRPAAARGDPTKEEVPNGQVAELTARQMDAE